MWSGLNLRKQSPALIISGLVLLLLLIGGTFLAGVYFNSSLPKAMREGYGAGLGMVPSERPSYDLAQKFSAIKNSTPSAAVEPIKIETKIIKTASLSFQVKDYQKNRAAIENTVKENGGYVASENQQNGTDRIGNTIVIRVPAANLERLIESLQGQAAYLDYKNIDARDVTEEFVDTEARLKTKRQVEQRYLAVLKQAVSVKDILEVEARLGAIREEIEATEGRLKYLNDQIAYSTVTLYIYQPIHRLPRPERGFTGRLGKALVNGWNGLLGSVIGLMSIWPLWVLVFAGGVGYRFWKKKR